MSNIIHSHRNITSGMYKGVGEVDVGGELPAGGRLCPLLGLFEVAVGLRSASHRPKHKPR